MLWLSGRFCAGHTMARRAHRPSCYGSVVGFARSRRSSVYNRPRLDAVGMTYIRVKKQSLIASVAGLVLLLLLLLRAGRNSPPPPCPLLPNVSHAPSLVSIWDRERLDGLWAAQGIPRHDTGGGINPRQGRRYADMAIMDSKLKVKVVCESGFFRGGSTLFWLMLFEDSIVHSFDLSFPDGAIQWFHQKYPGRLVVHQGDSKQLIAALPRDTCDWVSVDGDHGPGGAYHDIQAFSRVSKPGALLVSDDTFDCTLSSTSCTECGDRCPCRGDRPFCNECSRGFHQSVDERVVEWLGCDRYGVSADGKYPIGSCHGYLVNAAA